MPLNSNKKPSRKAKVLPQFSFYSRNKPLLDLLEIQRKSFFDLLENGIIDELSKTDNFRETAKFSGFTQELNLSFNPETYKLVSPNCTPKEAILKGKTYACKLYVQATLTIQSAPPASLGETNTKTTSVQPSVVQQLASEKISSVAKNYCTLPLFEEQRNNSFWKKPVLRPYACAEGNGNEKAQEFSSLSSKESLFDLPFKFPERLSSYGLKSTTCNNFFAKVPSKFFAGSFKSVKVVAQSAQQPKNLGNVRDSQPNRLDFALSQNLVQEENKVHHLDFHMYINCGFLKTAILRSISLRSCSSSKNARNLLRFVQPIQPEVRPINYFPEKVAEFFDFTFFNDDYKSFKNYLKYVLAPSEHKGGKINKKTKNQVLTLKWQFIWKKIPRFSQFCWENKSLYRFKKLISLPRGFKPAGIKKSSTQLLPLSYLANNKSFSFPFVINFFPNVINSNSIFSSHTFKETNLQSFNSNSLSSLKNKKVSTANVDRESYLQDLQLKLFNHLSLPEAHSTHNKKDVLSLWDASLKSSKCTFGAKPQKYNTNKVVAKHAFSILQSKIKRSTTIFIGTPIKRDSEIEKNSKFSLAKVGQQTKLLYSQSGQYNLVQPIKRFKNPLTWYSRIPFYNLIKTQNSSNISHLEFFNSYVGYTRPTYLETPAIWNNSLRKKTQFFALSPFIQRKQQGAYLLHAPCKASLPMTIPCSASRCLCLYRRYWQWESTTKSLGSAQTKSIELPIIFGLPSIFKPLHYSRPVQFCAFNMHKLVQPTVFARFANKKCNNSLKQMVSCCAPLGHANSYFFACPRGAQHDKSYVSIFPKQLLYQVGTKQKSFKDNNAIADNQVTNVVVARNSNTAYSGVSLHKENLSTRISRNETNYSSKPYVCSCDSTSQKQTMQKKDKGVKVGHPWIFLGELPLMTKRGHFILNGSPRVIVNQIARCPGIYFQEKRRGVGFEQEVRVSADLIPQQGPWLRIQSDWEGRFWARLKREGRVKYATLYEAFQEFEKQYTAPLVNLINNNSSSLPKSEIVAFHERKAKEDRQKKALVRLFKNSTRYSLGKQGRWRINQRVHISRAQKIFTSILPAVKKVLAVETKVVKKHEKAWVAYSFDQLRWSKGQPHNDLLYTFGARKMHPEDIKKQAHFSLSASLFCIVKTPVIKSSRHVINFVDSKIKYSFHLLPPELNQIIAHQDVLALTEHNNSKTNKVYGDDKLIINECFALSPSVISAQPSFSTQSLVGNEIIWRAPEVQDQSIKPTSLSFKPGDRVENIYPPRNSFFKKNRVDDSETLLTAADINAVHTCLERLLEGKGFTDDIDHLKNRLVRTSGKLLQTQLQLGLTRLNEVITPLLGNLIQGPLTSATCLSSAESNEGIKKSFGKVTKKHLVRTLHAPSGGFAPEVHFEDFKEASSREDGKKKVKKEQVQSLSVAPKIDDQRGLIKPNRFALAPSMEMQQRKKSLSLRDTEQEKTNKRVASDLRNVHSIQPNPQLEKSAHTVAVQSKEVVLASKQNTRNSLRSLENETPFRWLRTSKPVNNAFREFFGSNPLSQYMDQTNPLAEITHKRRLSSMGPGGIKRETAGMEVRGIHPTHYGRVCPIETPEGKNAGLVNSPTVYGRINDDGFMETPLYQVLESQVQKERWIFFSAQQEEDQESSVATGDTGLTRFNLLSHLPIPVQTANNPLAHFQQVERNRVGYKALSPVQTISIATALIPFLEHDDANRALMGSNMQRQAIPLISPERPIVGTGFEPLVMVESGQSLQAIKMGYVSHVSASQITIESKHSIWKAPLSVDSCPYNAFDIASSFCASPAFAPSDQRSCCLPRRGTEDAQKEQTQAKQNQQATRITFGESAFSLPSLKCTSLHAPKGHSTAKHAQISQQGRESSKAGNAKKIVRSKKEIAPSKYSRVQTGDSISKMYRKFFNTMDNFKKVWWNKNTLTRSFYCKSCTLTALNLPHLVPLVALQINPSVFYASYTLSCFPQQKGRAQVKESKEIKGWSGFLCALCNPIYNWEKVQKTKSDNFPNFLPTALTAYRRSQYKPLEFASNTLGAAEQAAIPLSLRGQTHVTNFLNFSNKICQAPKISRGLKIGNYLVGEPIFKESLWHLKKPFWNLSLNENFSENVFQLLKIKPSRDRNSSAFSLQNMVLATSVNSHEIEPRTTRDVNCIDFFACNTTKGLCSLFLSPSCMPERGTTLKARGAKASTHFLYKASDLWSSQINNKFDTEGNKDRLVFSEAHSQKYNHVSQKSTEMLYISKKIPHQTSINLHLCATQSAFLFKRTEQPLQLYQRSNQETCLSQRPLVCEGEWVHKGDILADCSASHSGDLALGKNVTVAYMPWEGYNFEDAIVISDRLVADDVYTSIHIERYELRVSKNSQGKERITNQIPSLPPQRLKHLNSLGISRVSSWVQPGDILVGKVVELKRPLSPYERLAWELASRLSPASPEREKWLSKVWLEDISLRLPPGVCGRVINFQIISTEWSEKEQIARPLEVHVYLAIKRKIQVGDKLAGRHGNKGIVSIVLPRQDMPYLADGTSVDMVLNPLGVPSRMNLGQIFECLLGLAGSQLGCNFKVTPFDEIAGGEASRSLVFLKLYQSRLTCKQQWLFTPTFPGKNKLFDGRTGEPFENWVTVGRAYMLKLIHMVDHKIHARSTGPYSLFTRQPVRGRSRRGGQRLGEMEVWAVEGFGAAYTLQEFLTVKSDDLKSRAALQKSFYKQNDITLGQVHISPGNPEAFRVLISELQALCLHIQM